MFRGFNNTVKKTFIVVGTNENEEKPGLYLGTNGSISKVATFIDQESEDKFMECIATFFTGDRLECVLGELKEEEE